jgi:poly-gamma-glutamate capsule biosynthesis protein CapA/YwtB (metallophosphatase superfamily)
VTTTTNQIDGRSAALVALAVAIMVALVVAWRIDAEATTVPPGDTFTLRVADEDGDPISGATVEQGDTMSTTDAGGEARFELHEPVLAVVTADGMLADAVVIGVPGTNNVSLRLLAREGPNGTRTVMQFGGDFMMGRRYQEPILDGTAVVTDAESARAVVAEIAPLFSLADLASVNFESVAGTLADEDAHVGKLYLLQSPPEAVAALDELGVNVANMGNNHVNDWDEAGIASTIRILDDAGIAHPGAGLTESEALQPVIVTAGDLEVGLVAMTTVSGEYVNDRLPDATAPIPATAAPSELWQYEARTFGFGSPGDANYVASAQRRPGPMWRLFDELEPSLSTADAADLWQAISRVYPELLDSVARHGHGGAAHYSPAAVAASVAAARKAGADVVVVQLHGGPQFAAVPSAFFTSAARAAVDAGADLVVGHHPHVLQGFEFYKGKLIAYSLGNFVFDEDFLSTHPSAILRTVFEGTDLIDTTVYPVMVDDYRPMAVGGAVADRILAQMSEASLQEAVSVQTADAGVGATPTKGAATATVAVASGRGTIVPAQEPITMPLTLETDVPTALDGTLVAIDDGAAGLTLGRDLFGYGDLEDVGADGAVAGGLEWSLPPDSLEIDRTSPVGMWTARIDRTSQHLTDATVRTAARISLPAHRWFDAGGAPLDGPPAYSVRLWGRRVGAGIPFVRIWYYAFDDTDPTREPDSARLDTVDIPLPLANDGEWHELWLDVGRPPEGANTGFFGVGLAPPESQSGTVWIDGLQVVEWRKADSMPAGTWIPTDYVRADRDRSVELTVAAQ